MRFKNSLWWHTVHYTAGADHKGEVYKASLSNLSPSFATTSQSTPQAANIQVGCSVPRITWEIYPATPNSELEDLSTVVQEPGHRLWESMAGLAVSGLWYIEYHAAMAAVTPLSHGMQSVTPSAEYLRGSLDLGRAPMIFQHGENPYLIVRVDNSWTPPVAVNLRFTVEFDISNYIEIG